MRKISSYPICLKRQPDLKSVVFLNHFARKSCAKIYLHHNGNTISLGNLIDPLFFFYQMKPNDEVLIIIEGSHTFNDFKQIAHILQSNNELQTI